MVLNLKVENYIMCLIVAYMIDFNNKSLCMWRAVIGLIVVFYPVGVLGLNYVITWMSRGSQ